MDGGGEGSSRGDGMLTHESSAMPGRSIAKVMQFVKIMIRME